MKADSRHARNIDPLLIDVLALLAAGQPLPEKNRDHALSGEWNGYRDCHLKPDLLLIYGKPDEETPRLAGSDRTANCSIEQPAAETVVE